MIDFLLYLGFAGKEALGCDSTVRRVSDDFVYAVGKTFYRTVGKLIAEDNAFFTIGRGVRVWKVRRCNQAGTITTAGQKKMNVLKDLWQFEDVDSEKKMQENIRQALREAEGEETANKLNKYFSRLFTAWMSHSLMGRWIRLPQVLRAENRSYSSRFSRITGQRKQRLPRA